MSINKDYFLEVLDKYKNLVDTENNQNLRQSFNKFQNGVLSAISQKESRNTDTYAFLHEIKTYFMLKSLGINFSMANDNNPGPDFVLSNVYLECVTLGYGQSDVVDIFEDLTSSETTLKVRKYEYDRIALRVLSALDEKKRRYNDYIKNGVIPSNDRPFIVFISYGMLNQNILEDHTAKRDILLPLLGVGSLALRIDTNTGDLIDTSNTFKDNIQKSNGTLIGTCAFHDCRISAVIVTSAWLSDDYNPSNTVVFYNPYVDFSPADMQFLGYNYWIREGENAYVLQRQNSENITKHT